MQFWPIPAIFWVLQSNHEIVADGMSIIHPKAYLQASFEVFILMLALCWILTAWFNPSIMDSNRIRDVFGYNNVCVGFDTVPARYFAQPLMCLQGYMRHSVTASAALTLTLTALMFSVAHSLVLSATLTFVLSYGSPW